MGTRGHVALALLLLSALLLTYTFRDELQAAHDALQLTSEHRPLGRVDRDAPVKSVTVFRNGFSTGGVEMELSAAVLATKRAQAGDLAAYLSQFVAVEGPFTSDTAATNERSDAKDDIDDDDVDDVDVARVVADRVFTGRGELVQTFSDVRSGDVLYLVAPGLSFMWPFVALGHRVVVTLETGPNKGEPVVIESISETPRTFRLHQFFRDDEADALIQQTRQRGGGGGDGSQPSSRDAGSGKHRMASKTKARSGESVFDAVSDTAVNMRKRVLQVLLLGRDSDEKAADLELLQYQPKQAYVPHDDYFLVGAAHGFRLDLPQGGSDRFATVFLHLSDVARGGQTVFPLADMPADGLPAEYGHPLHAAQDYGAAGAELFEPGSPQMDMVRSCSTKLAFYPSRGSAVLFYGQKPNGEPDPMSLYGGCPVIEGVKWGASLRVGKRHRRDLDVDPLACSVTFTNPTSCAVKLYWSDKLMSTLAANGGSITYNSFSKHKWVLKAGDRVLLEYIVDATDGEKRTVTVPLVHKDATNQPAASVTDQAKKRLSTNADTKDEL
ncbi:unnamed protein product [Hyaloperonospora brassicae]|uniref:Prolyl 4-hydroxylase alpha subunit domain-containing protein n=1 Tax=Hyaloperonospora brassicae TaxID=162125 RepID=A0AAV0UHC4_HYABA|nr:unnamed protein product [Hyaloperonospora brassicae]